MTYNADDALRDRFKGQAARIAGLLRDCADYAERHVEPTTDLHDLKPDLSYRAAEIAHNITSTIANLGLDALIQAASEHDRIVRQGLTPTTAADLAGVLQAFSEQLPDDHRDRPGVLRSAEVLKHWDA
jgi:hypothetical protein